MQILNLIILIIAFLVILGILIFLYVYRPAQKRKAQEAKKRSEVPKEKPTKPEIPTFEALYNIMKKRSSSTEALRDAVDQTLKHYGTIKAKNGMAPSKEFKSYGEMMFIVARHPNTTKEIILHFDKELIKRNPGYRREIDEMLNRGLTARG